MDKSEPQKFSEKYFGIKEDYIPTFKDTSDNLRAYLTVVAYSIAIKYLWELQPHGTFAIYIFRAVAFLWGVWVAWFFLLSIVQTFHLANGWMIELIVKMFAGSISRANDPLHPFSRAHQLFIKFVAYFSASMGMVFLLGTIYITNALLSLAQLK